MTNTFHASDESVAALQIWNPADVRSSQNRGYDLVTTSGWFILTLPVFTASGAKAMAMR